MFSVRRAGSMCSLRSAVVPSRGSAGLFGCAFAVGIAANWRPFPMLLSGRRCDRLAAVGADIAVLPLRCWCGACCRGCIAVAGLARHTRRFAVRTNHLFGVYVLYQNLRENTSSFGKKVRKIPKKHMKNTLLRQNSPQNPKIPATIGKIRAATTNGMTFVWYVKVACRG